MAYSIRLDILRNKTIIFTDKKGYKMGNNLLSNARARPIILIFSIVFVCLLSVSSQESDLTRKGHLEPLGYQAGGMHPADETMTLPGSQEFYDNYVKKVKPLVFREAAKIFPAFKTWTDAYLKQEFADLEFRIERKKNLGYVSAPIGDIALGKATLKHFIDTYHEDDTFLVSSLPTPMWKDVLLLPFLTCGSFKNRILHQDIWMSGGGTSTTLHRDKFQKIQCLINGTKEWKLVALDDQDKIYSYRVNVNEELFPPTGSCVFDPDCVDLDKFPNISKVSVVFANLNPGDCVYVPQKMYHHVKSDGLMNIAVNTQFSLFKYDKKLNFSDCDASQINYKSPLKHDVDWPFTGKGMLPFLYPDLITVKVKLFSLLKRKGENFQRSLMYKLANNNMWNERSITRYRITRGVQEIVDIIRNKSKEENITRHQILRLTKSELRRIALIWNPIIPQNLHKFEYYLISQKDIAILLSILSNRFGGLIKKDDFVKMYCEYRPGTKQFAEQCFQAIAGGENHLITREEIRRNFANGVAKYTLFEENEEEKENKLLDYKPETEYVLTKRPLEGERDTELFDALNQQIKKVYKLRANNLETEIASYLNLKHPGNGNTVLTETSATTGETDVTTNFKNKLSNEEQRRDNLSIREEL